MSRDPYLDGIMNREGEPAGEITNEAAAEIFSNDSQPVIETTPHATVTKTFLMAGNRDGEILEFVISEPIDPQGDVCFSLAGHALPDWFIDVIWGLILGFKDPAWIRLLVYWAKSNGIMKSTFLGNHDLVDEIMDYLRAEYSVEDAVNGS